MKKYLLHIILIFVVANVFGQAEPSFDQYHFNQLAIHPAYAGTKGTFEATVFARRQWTAIDGAPDTESLTLSTQLANGKVGLGGKVLHDKIGVTDKYTFAIDYAYRIYTGGGVLSIGIELAADQFNLNYIELDAYQDGDPAFLNVPQNFTSFNAGAGAWFQNDIVFAGLSVPRLLASGDEITTSVDSVLNKLEVFDQSRNFYLTGGVLIKVSDLVDIKPYVLARYDFAAPPVIDNSISLIFADAFWIGGTYRTTGAFSIMSQYILNAGNSIQDRYVSIGYAYSQQMDNYQSLFGPTHELFVSFLLDKKTTQYKSPRFF